MLGNSFILLLGSATTAGAAFSTRSNSHKEINLKESIYELSVVSCALGKADEEAKERIYMKLNASSGGNIKPGFVLESFCNSISYELPPFGYTVHRIETYREREGEFVPLLWEKS